MNLILFKKSLFFIIITLFSALLASCDPIVPNTQGSYMAKLFNVNVNNRPAKSNELQAVQIIRNNRRIPTRYNMYLYPGDRVITSTTASVFLVYKENSELMININTDVTLRNPIFQVIFNKVGEIFLNTRSHFEVKDEFGSVINEGTRYSVVKRGNRLKVAVIEGQVRITSAFAQKPNWSGTIIRARQAVVRRDARNLSPRYRLSNREFRRIKRWTEPLKRKRRPTSNNNDDDVSPFDPILRIPSTPRGGRGSRID